MFLSDDQSEAAAEPIGALLMLLLHRLAVTPEHLETLQRQFTDGEIELAIAYDGPPLGPDGRVTGTPAMVVRSRGADLSP